MKYEISSIVCIGSFEEIKMYNKMSHHITDTSPFEELRELLAHMHVAELKDLLTSLRLSAKAFNKQELIDRLVHYKKTGNELAPQEIPLVSRARRGLQAVLMPERLMLYGSYKNDYATRDFFKKLVGNHFHFTAYGIDWLRERWLEGKPPTYAEFAREWQEEFERNKVAKRPAKQEWAYIRFVQDYTLTYPEAAVAEINAAWEKWRSNAVMQARRQFNI